MQVVIAKVDCTEERDIGTRFEVSGYPTIKYFPAGASKEPQAYQGAREVKDFVEFINKEAGTERTAEGGLLASAGRVAALDALVSSGE